MPGALETDNKFVPDLGNAHRRSLNALSAGQVKSIIRNLQMLRLYFEHGSECRVKVDDCIEVAQGHSDFMVRREATAARRERNATNLAHKRRKKGTHQ